jgi:hypothetical protein
MNVNREAFVSSAEHTLAVARLGTDSYSVEEYLLAIDMIRATGRAEEYVDKVLGAEPDSAATETDAIGADLHTAALAILAAKGKGETYSADEYLAACSEAGA